MSNNNKSHMDNYSPRLRPKRKPSSVFLSDVKKEANPKDDTQDKNGSDLVLLKDDKKVTNHKKQKTLACPTDDENKIQNKKKCADNKEPAKDDVKISDVMADACKTICKICHKTFRLSMMRLHTLKHGLQITKFKEIHGNFHEDKSMIVEIVYHKCHLCGKLILLDNDALGGHIKGVHKWTEKDYKGQFMTLSVSKGHPTPQKNVDMEYDVDNVKFKPVGSGDSVFDDVEYDFETTFPEFEYDCNLSDCNLCNNNESFESGDSDLVLVTKP